MKRVLGLLVVMMLCTSAAMAQVTLKGKVVGGDNGQPIVGAYIMINASEPELARRTSLTDEKGEFSVISREKSTNITVKFIGYKDYYKVIEPTATGTVDLGTIRLAVDALVAEAVEVKALAPAAVLKGDTIQYNSAAFKANPDASSEDLLLKMPGVVTNDDGAVEVHGETVGKVYVDGKEFFADDPAVALKTLPADVVESMQIFDDQSDEAKFSGFDDGQRIKAINIVTKGGVATSTFGKAYAGYGSRGTYTAGVAANIFNVNQRWTILGSRNNINNQGFTLEDIASSMSGGRGGMGGGVDASQFTTSVRGGVRTSTMAGLNYNGEFEKVKVGASYFFNNVNADQWRTVQQNYISAPRDYFDSTGSEGYNYQHRLNARIEWNPNETNRIFFSPSVSYSTNHGESWKNTWNYLNSDLESAAKNRYTTKLGTYSVNANLFWMHRFTKPGRTISLGGMIGGSNGWGRRTQLSEYVSKDEFDNWLNDVQDQFGSLGTPQFNIMGRVSYAEPLSKSSRLQLSYNLSYNKTDSRKLTYDYNDLTEIYDELDPATSNLFNRDQTRHRGSLSYNLVREKVVLNASATYQHSTLNNDQTFPRQLNRTYDFNGFVPNVRFEFRPSKTQTLMVNYDRSTSTPNVTQLQDVWDITNVLQPYIGNPDLKQSFNDRLSIRYNSVNPEKATFFQLRAGGGLTQDYIAYNRRFLDEATEIEGILIPSGARISTPVNLSGYVNANFSAMYSFPLRFISSKFTVGGNYWFSKTPSMENDLKYKSTNHRVFANLSLTSNISESVDFTIAYRPSLNLTQGSTGSFDRYIGSNVSGNLNIFLVGGLFINAKADWRNSFGTRDDYGQHYVLLDAGIGYKFLKFRQAEVRVTGYDLLNQNQAFWQESYDTYTQINTTSILKRYVMVSFTYKFDTRKGRNAENYGTEDRGGRQGFGGPGGRPSGGRPAGGPGMGPR